MADTRKLAVRVPGSPEGEPIEVLFLGLHPNGSSITLTDEQVQTYEALSGRSFPKSGYLIAGEPKTDAEKKAAKENQAELDAELRATVAESDKEIEESTALIPGTSVPAKNEEEGK